MNEKNEQRKRVHDAKSIDEAMEAIKSDAPSFSEKYALPPGLQEELSSMSWESIANLADSLEVKIKRETHELRRIEKQLSMTILVLKERLRDGSQYSFDPKFLVELVRLLEKSERLAIQHEIDLSEFMLFLRIIVEKMKKEKLIFYDRKGEGYVKYQKDDQIDEFSKMMEKPDETKSVHEKKEGEFEEILKEEEKENEKKKRKKSSKKRPGTKKKAKGKKKTKSSVKKKK